jgi:hypothetical protein
VSARAGRACAISEVRQGLQRLAEAAATRSPAAAALGPRLLAAQPASALPPPCRRVHCRRAEHAGALVRRACSLGGLLLPGCQHPPPPLCCRSSSHYVGDRLRLSPTLLSLHCRYYDPRRLQADFGRITSYQAPKTVHPGTALAGVGAGHSATHSLGQPLPSQFQHSRHYHLTVTPPNHYLLTTFAPPDHPLGSIMSVSNTGGHGRGGQGGRIVGGGCAGAVEGESVETGSPPACAAAASPHMLHNTCLPSPRRDQSWQARPLGQVGALTRGRGGGWRTCARAPASFASQPHPCTLHPSPSSHLPSPPQ